MSARSSASLFVLLSVCTALCLKAAAQDEASRAKTRIEKLRKHLEESVDWHQFYLSDGKQPLKPHIVVRWDNQVRGPLSGELHLRGLGKNAELTARIDGSGMTVNRVAMPRLQVEVRATDRELQATLDAVQTQGNARAEFSAPSAWGARWAPELTSRAKAA